MTTEPRDDRPTTTRSVGIDARTDVREGDQRRNRIRMALDAAMLALALAALAASMRYTPRPPQGHTCLHEVTRGVCL